MGDHRELNQGGASRWWAWLVLVAGLASSACSTIPEPDPVLSRQSFELAQDVAGWIGAEPREVPAAWTTRISSSGGNYVERDRDGNELYRLILIRRDVPEYALRFLLAHELVHAHVADRGLSLFVEEGLCNLIAFVLDPEMGAEQLASWEEALRGTELDMAWAKTVTRDSFPYLTEEENTAFYAYAYRNVAEQLSRAGSVTPASIASITAGTSF